LVEQSADVSASGEIGGVAVASGVERCGKVGIDRDKLRTGNAEPLFDAGELAGDVFLLAGDEVQRDGAAVYGFEELVALGGAKDRGYPRRVLSSALKSSLTISSERSRPICWPAASYLAITADEASLKSLPWTASIRPAIVACGSDSMEVIAPSAAPVAFR